MIVLFFLVQSKAIAVAPAPLQNYCPVVIANNTGIAADKVYFVVHGLDENGIPCFFVPDVNGICQPSYPTPSGTPSSVSSSKTLSQLPQATGTGLSISAYLVYLPVNGSSRGYFSINNPMYLATALDTALGVLGVDDSSVTTLTDPNFYTFYQDFEFGLPQTNVNTSATEIFMNLSWVDYFCLPMELEARQYPSNTVISKLYTVLPSGTSKSRETIVSSMVSTLTSSSNLSGWGGLPIAYYTNPYTDTTPVTYLRILAAKNSISLGTTSTNFKGANVPQTYFPNNYISNSTSGPQTGKSFVQVLYDYLNSSSPFYAKIHPANLSATTYIVTANSTNLILDLTGLGGAPSYTLNLSALTTEQLLSGANAGTDWPYTLTSGTDSTAYTNELSKLFSALFTLGQLPLTAITTSALNPFDNSQYNSASDPGGYVNLTYFQNQSLFTQKGPWYNLYDKALHPLLDQSQGDIPGDKNPTFGLGYGYDYDDLLNMAGLIAQNIQDQYGNPSQETDAINPYLLITLESLSGSTIPDISQDSYAYPVTVDPAPNGTTVTFIHYNGTTTQNTVASATGATDLGTVHVDSSHPFQVKFSFDSTDYIYNINLQRQVVTPTSSTYNNIDQQFQQSIQFTVSAGPSFSISYNSSPPQWPG